MLNRRAFLSAVGALASVAACRRSGAAAEGSSARARKLDRIGIQLYTVRRDMRRDMPGTLARIAEIGYREVEFAGYFDRSPADVRRLLDQHKLTAPSTHVDISQVRSDRVFDAALEMGHHYVVVPSLPAEMRVSKDTWRGVAAEFNRAGERARAKGLRFAFHNHGTEVKKVDDFIPLELLLADTDPALVSFQLDVFWMVSSGGDPIDYLRRHPTRFTMLHVKDSSGAPGHQQVDIGAGVIDFASILRQDADASHAIRHVFVEHDDPPDPFAFAKTSFDYLSRSEF